MEWIKSLVVNVILHCQEKLGKSSNASVRIEYIAVSSTEPDIPRIQLLCYCYSTTYSCYVTATAPHTAAMLLLQHHIQLLCYCYSTTYSCYVTATVPHTAAMLLLQHHIQLLCYCYSITYSCYVTATAPRPGSHFN